MNLKRVRNDLAPEGTLVASINLGNPVLATGTADAPGGVTVDIAREIARRLGLALEFQCFQAARHSFAALSEGTARLGFLAIDPRREEQLYFTSPYVLIEGVYVVAPTSPIATPEGVDQEGNRVGVKQGSAYDLYLSRNLQRASLVRGAEGTTVFVDQELEVGAGIRQPVQEFVDTHPGYRLLEPPFMQIRQAVALPRHLSEETLDYLEQLVAELKADGFVAKSLQDSGQGALTIP